MLIAHVITRLLRGGCEENTIATCMAQARAGHKVVLIHGQERDISNYYQCGSLFRIIPIKSLVRNIDPVKDLMALRELQRIFHRLSPDVVHTHESKAGVLGRTAAFLAGVPTIVHGVHIAAFLNVDAIQRALYLTAERAVAPFTHAFINVSRGMYQACVDHGIGDPSQHFIVHSGMELSRFRNAAPPANWRSILGISDVEARPPVVLMLAAFETRKRQLELIESFERVVARIPNVRLLLAGEGETRGAAESAVAHSGLSENIRFLGHHSQPEELIALADVCLLTSKREGLPRVVVQYLAGGRPVVVTQLPGIEEVVCNGINGIVTSGEPLAETADVLAELLLDPGRLATLREGATRTDVSNWALDTMCSKISDIYQRVAGAQRNQPAGRWQTVRRGQRVPAFTHGARQLSKPARQRTN